MSMTSSSSSSSFSSLPFIFPGVSGVQCLFTTRAAGNLSGSAMTAGVISNRRRLMEESGFSEWAENYQVHGDLCLEAEAGSPSEEPPHSADGLFTHVRGRALLIKTADCQAILFAGKDGKAIGAIHAGWRGNRLHFPTTAIIAFCERYGYTPQDVVAVRGPSLGSGVAEFVNFAEEWGDEYAPWFNEKSKTMDLWGLTRYQLEQAGVPPAQIYGLDFCTLSNPELFYSYRRKDAERQMAAIWIG